jgi:two-component system response regulator FixJ
VSDNNQQRICIIDDDEAVRDSTRLMLETCGMTVREFASPREFLNERAFENCACLVLDLHMPAMSGLDLLEVLRAKNIAVPAVMVTGYPREDLAARLWNAGLSALLQKPVSESELLDRIATAIASSLH